MNLLFSQNQNKLVSLLKVLSKDQQVLFELGVGRILHSKELEKSYQDWVRLISTFKDREELEFFRTSWVPICFDQYFFIDMANEDWSIFGFAYWPLNDDEDFYHKIFYFMDMEDMLNNLGDFEYLKKVRNQNRADRLNRRDDWLESLINQ